MKLVIRASALLLGTLAVGALALTPLASGQGAETSVSLGKFNLSKIFTSAPQMKKLTKEVESLYGARGRSLRKQLSQIEEKLRALQDATHIPMTERVAQQKKLLAEHNKVKADSVKLNAAADARKLKFLKTFEPLVMKTVERIGRERGIDLILAGTDVDTKKAASASALAGAITSRTVWFTSKRVQDLTDDVLKALKAE